MAKAVKFYVVWRGHNPGIYDNWLTCKAQIDGYQGAQYKSFPSKIEADAAIQDSYWNYVNKEDKVKTKSTPKENLPIEHNSICVDAACSGNPGDMEYRCVDIQTGKELFKRGPYKEGTNNIGEFLALVHGIAYLKKNNLTKSIYSDSETAMAWVRNKKAKTKLEMTKNNEELFDLILRAENYIKRHTIDFNILKWDTENWGEIPADFGRK